jgi:hypothetical protein
MANPRNGRRGRAVTLAAEVASIAKPILGERGFAAGAVVSEWAAIVGPELARVTMPEKIVYPRGRSVEGALRLRIASGAAAVEVQHLEPVLVERINGYFGYRAVARLRLVQGPIAGGARASRPATRTLAPEEERELAARVAPVADARLRQSLHALGRAILGRQERTRKGAARR